MSSLNFETLTEYADHVVRVDPQGGSGSTAVHLNRITHSLDFEDKISEVVAMARLNNVAVLYRRSVEANQLHWNQVLIQGPSNLVAWTLRELDRAVS